MSDGKRILVVKLSSLGDLFHALPAVHGLRLGLGASVDWLTQTEYVPLVRCFDDVENVIRFPRRHFFRNALPFLKAVRSRRYDLVIDLQGLLKSAFGGRFARADRRIGPSYSREGARFLYDAVAGECNKNRHAVEEAMDVVRFLDLPVPDPVFPVTFPKVSLPEGAPRVAFIPRSRWETKNWPAARFVEVGRALLARAKASIYLLGSLGDLDACLGIQRALGRGVYNLCAQTSMVELGGFLQAMDLVVTVDSGPMHMAAALGKPVVAVFGATDARRTGPFGPGHRIVTKDDLDCRPCFSGSCRRHDIACLTNLPAEPVIEAALQALGV